MLPSAFDDPVWHRVMVVCRYLHCRAGTCVRPVDDDGPSPNDLEHRGALDPGHDDVTTGRGSQCWNRVALRVEPGHQPCFDTRVVVVPIGTKDLAVREIELVGGASAGEQTRFVPGAVLDGGRTMHVTKGPPSPSWMSAMGVNPWRA